MGQFSRNSSPEEPGHADYHYTLALLYGETGRAEDAVRALQRTVEADPDFGRAWYNLGLAHAQLEQLDRAVDALRKAEQLTVDLPDVPYARATVHMRQGNKTAAREAAETALKRDPAHVEARSLLSVLRAE